MIIKFGTRGDPVTLWDAIFAILLAVLICRAKGNVAKLIWSTS